jgi:hypothetical protein
MPKMEINESTRFFFSAFIESLNVLWSSHERKMVFHDAVERA